VKRERKTYLSRKIRFHINNLLELDSLVYNIGHMKSFIAGLLTIVILGTLGFLAFKATTNFMGKLTPSPSATPSASATPTPSVIPSAKPSITPEPSIKPTTKGGTPVKSGTVKGVSTIKTTNTTTHLTLTLAKTNACPVSYMTEINDIKGPLTLKYSLKDGYSFGITAWKKDGNEIIGNTTYSGSNGTIKTIDGVDYVKVRIESKTCSSTSDNWLTITAER
jgi:hypothetical protein